MRREIQPTVPRQLAMALDVLALEGLGATERTQIVTLLAHLLLEASGVMDEEGNDDDF